MSVESRRRLFIHSIDHESCCVIDEPSKLFAACSMEHGYPRSGPQQRGPIASFELENSV